MTFVSPVLAGAATLLSSFITDTAPWINIEANSEQRQPLYFGLTPRQLARHEATPAEQILELPDFLKGLAESQVSDISSRLGISKKINFEIEAWPTQNDLGQWTWVLARWRLPADLHWNWLDQTKTRRLHGQVKPVLPRRLSPSQNSDHALLFGDFLESADLYDKPEFGNCVWVTRDDETQVVAGWLPLQSHLPPEKIEADAWKNLTCMSIPQPARLNGKPLSLVFRVENSHIIWPRDIRWISRPSPSTSAKAHALHFQNSFRWPENFIESYQNDVEILSGEKDAQFPLSGKIMRFTKKNSADPENQLEHLVDYLEERYRAMGIQTLRQRFIWRGIKQSNLIAIIPGHPETGSQHPVLLADHIDTAFSEDVFKKTGNRVSTPGANDNTAATASLLRAAAILRGSRLNHDVWLTHLTGEEFPGDDLGARKLVSRFLRTGQELSGVIVLDMIARRRPDDPWIQIHAGASPESLELAEFAMAEAGQALSTNYRPVLRERFDPRSYLYNTDGLIFSDSGYPVILLNEHINALENFNAFTYHQSSDRSSVIDWGYAEAITRLAVSTAYRLAESSDSR